MITNCTIEYVGNCRNPVVMAAKQLLGVAAVPEKIRNEGTNTGLPNKVCPSLRDSACWRSGEITQPRTSLIREPCTAAT